MDEFVNWDHADPASGAGVDMLAPSLLPPGQSPEDDLGLALANVDGDDFSFWALQHFENNISPTLGSAEDVPMPSDSATRALDLKMFEAPCNNCQLGGYQCKRIPEGQYKGHCTSCVALRCACSFGPSSDFPANPWPIMGDHPEAILQEDLLLENPPSNSATDLPSLVSASGPDTTNVNAGPKGKAGARFSRESVKILKNWLSTHSKHPYPNDEEKERLQLQTGLSKTQITNWLANTRRRNKNAVSQRSTSPGVRSWANPIDIPQRRGTPAALENMNPLQRWAHSPPENEPASVTAIARAVKSASSISSGLNSPHSLNFTDDGSGRSLCDSNISSANTSHSTNSAYSFNSRGSFGSAGSSIPRGRRRRRRKAPAAAPAPSNIPKTFQCTFCTETFRTKHDWQRHEKSLHLSLERWVCSPNGAKAFNPENGQISCVFCGEPHPDEAHIDTHNHSACQERTMAERTFYRKDHLRQHLKLVHGAKFASWSMDQWKATTPEIRSRCGFCGTVMDTWSIRVDHLAEHFKKGKSMADWKGDWGFDDPVLEMVENSIPPCMLYPGTVIPEQNTDLWLDLIHNERNSPNPFEASQPSAASARYAFELIKSELTIYLEDWREKEGKTPSDEDLQRAACALVYDSEEVSKATAKSKASWLRDLIFSSDRLAQEARWLKVKGLERWHQLQINGKGNIFELDPMEAELHEFVKARRLLGLTAMDSELQAEACNIIRRMEEASSYSSEEVTQFLIRLVFGSTDWLAGFRQRSHLPRSEDMADEGKRSKDPTTIDSTVHNPKRLEFELAEYVRGQMVLGIEVTDADLQRQARIIIYEYDDGWNQTAADDPIWMAAFRQQHVPSNPSTESLFTGIQMPPLPAAADIWSQPVSTSNRSPSSGTTSPFNSSRSGSGIASVATHKLGGYYLNDANCYVRLTRELKKFVAATMSPNNPNCHVPSDEEIQHQARWIVYEDDDPWNQTAADNFEWLRRFKRDVGLLTDPSLPGLPTSHVGWNTAQGGSGFSPPYACPNPAKAVQVSPPFSSHNNMSATMDEAAKPITAAANRFVRGLGEKRPAAVFCSRDLERELSEFVTAEVVASGGVWPSDERIRERAKQVLGEERTPVDDAVLLGRFREVMRGRLGLGGDEQVGGGMGMGMGTETVGVLPVASAEMNFSAASTGAMDRELDDVLQQMDFDFGDMGDLMGVATGGMPMDQI